MSKNQINATNSTYKMIFVGTGLTGLVTIVILGVAIGVGLALDEAFSSAKHIFTVILVVISIPLNILGLLWAARYTAEKYGVPNNKVEKNDEEQEDA